MFWDSLGLMNRMTPFDYKCIPSPAVELIEERFIDVVALVESELGSGRSIITYHETVPLALNAVIFFYLR